MASKSVQKRVEVQKRVAAPSKVVAVIPPKSIAVGGWRERAAKSIAAGKLATARLPQQTGNFISFRGGSPSLGGVNLPNPLPLVILAYGAERAYYSKPYQPDVLSAPDCYSFDGIAPHPQAKVAQSDACSQCRFNEFGSAANAKGKACKEGARFAAIHADALESPEKIAAATIVQGRLSVLNSKGFRVYAGYFEEKEVPIWQSVSMLHVSPDSKSQYAVAFTNTVADLDDTDLDAIAARVDDAERLIVQPYPDIEDAAPAKAQAPARKRKF
jgi:hypothetical protein